MGDMNRLRNYLLVLIFVVAACGTQPTEVIEVPTSMQLPTVTDTLVPSITPTPSETLTLTATETPTETLTVTVSITPSITITNTASPTATETPAPTADAEAIGSLLELALQATVLPPEFIIPTANLASPIAPSIPQENISCATNPGGRIGDVLALDLNLAALLGCPIGSSSNIITASQVFERGSMLYMQGSPGSIFVLTSNRRWRRYDDSYNAATDPESTGLEPPAPNLREPVRGFGKIWRAFGDVQDQLGWATTDEAGNESTVQMFERGMMMTLPQRDEVLALINDLAGGTGDWRTTAGAG
jgi:hypothetical protein